MVILGPKEVVKRYRQGPSSQGLQVTKKLVFSEEDL
jgi:hypothetical protein